MTDGSRECACGRPERCWPGSESCAFMDIGYPWCRVCRENHRAPECAVDMAALDARIDALHGPGAAKALDEAYADGSIFSDHDAARVTADPPTRPDGGSSRQG